MSHCPQCAIEVDPRSPLGLCPVCSLRGLGFSDDEERSNRLIPGVELGRLIGKGASGEVYEGHETSIGFRRVAVKILSSDQPGFQRARFLDETEILSKLNHRNLATLYRSGKTADGDPYYVMELVEGTTLDRWAEGKSLDERLQIFTQIVEAVTYAHEEGVAHRDLKPSNILVSSDRNEVKVIDFGIARAVADPSEWGRDATLAGQRMGTPRYMSPEQLAGDAHVDLRTDIWSLGLILYELVLKRPVLAGVSDARTSWEENAQSLKSHILPELPQRELDWIARKACMLDRKQRYQSGSALLADLRAYENGEAVSVGLSHRRYRFQKSLARHRLAWASGIFLTIFLLSLATGSWLMMRKEQEANEEIAESLKREQEQHQAATAAELEMRRASSDTSLLASVRASNAKQYAETRRLLRKSLELWPGNEAAQFSLNYLQAILPEPLFLDELTLPFSVQNVSPHPEGGFLIPGPENKSYRLLPDGTLHPATAPFRTSKPLIEDDFEVIQTRDLVEFRNFKTQTAILSPLILDNTSERATYSHRDSCLLVYDGSPTIKRWEVGRHLSRYREVTLDEDVIWLEFTRETSSLWLGSRGRSLFEWEEGESPKFFAKNSSFSQVLDPWKVGEGHDRGLPDEVSVFFVFLQINGWQLMGEDKYITLADNARLADLSIVARADGTLWTRKPGSLFKKIASSAGEVSALAINAPGTMAARVFNGTYAELIDLDTKEILKEWTLPTPVHELSLLDTGELVASHHDGTVTIWDFQDLSQARATIKLAAKSPLGLHLRAVPHKAEFLCCLEGDIVIHHFSGLTGQTAGPPIRHTKGISWMLFTGNGDLLVTIDQSDEGGGDLRVWSLRLGSEVVPAIEHPDQILWITVLDNGTRIASSCADKKVRRWIIEDEGAKGN